MLGADKFVSYSTTAGPHLEIFERYYRRLGLLDMYNWDIPSNMSTYYRGQYALIQDCIYRYMFQSKYIALVNVDEFIFPRRHNNLLDLLSQLNCEDSGQFLFQNRFFPINLQQNKRIAENEMLKALESKVLSNIMKEDKQWGFVYRPKMIVNPRKIIIGQIHTVEEMIPGAKTCRVPASLAAMHHYRKWQVRDDVPIVEDTTAHRFLDKIQKRLLTMYHNFSLI